MANSSEDIRASMEQQIADLKKEMAKISKSLAARASDMADEAGEAFDEGKGRARQAVSQVRDQAQVAAGAMRENPGTAATVLSTVGLMGLAVGFVLGGAFSGGRR
ncbi:hypothetical protein [Paenirhodobacter sp.]|uniref:hypothetical protein n=1 Tax=Paenirhodobacter sp. TaxID=1965326 RepID=UPI003B4013F6